MTPAVTSPWWAPREPDGLLHPPADVPLYRDDEWIGVFLKRVRDVMAVAKVPPVRLDTTRDALVVTGVSAEGRLRTARASYLDVLLFHAGVHPTVEIVLAQAIRHAAQECMGMGFAQATELYRRGRDALLQDRSLLLSAEVVASLDRLGSGGLPPLGVSGVVRIDHGGRVYLLASHRSGEVAVNPDCIGTPVDGGTSAGAAGIDPRADLHRELADELDLHDGSLLGPWRELGTFVPPRDAGHSHGSPVRRGGVSTVFIAPSSANPRELLADIGPHFETRNLLLLDCSGSDGSDTSDGPPDGLVEVAGSVPLSETLAAVVALLSPSTAPPRLLIAPDRPPIHVRTPPRAHKVTAMSTDQVSVLDLRLEDRFSEELMVRFPRLRRTLLTEQVRDIAEKAAEPTAATLAPIIDVVREYDLIAYSDQLKTLDSARLFEAIVYRTDRLLFANDEQRALSYYDQLNRMQTRDEIGVLYTDRLAATTDTDPGTDAAHKTIMDRLEALHQDSAAVGYSEVARKAKLLCFCSALWAMEAKRSTATAAVALQDRFREALSGDAVALFFRARALLSSPVASTGQTQLGLQFVTAALDMHPKNAGMHHTRALLLLRRSGVTETQKDRLECLQDSLVSVESALLYDSEFPTFYATRANVRLRLGDRTGALRDLRAAIELARFGMTSSAIRDDITAWADLLARWELTEASSVEL